MRIKKLFFNFLVLIALLLSSGVYSQQTSYPNSFQDNYSKAKAMFAGKDYVAAKKTFQDLSSQVPTTDPIQFDIDYYSLLCGLRLNSLTAEQDVTAYLENSSSNPWSNQLRLELGRWQFKHEKYKNAVRNFEKVDRSELKDNELIELKFFSGYSYLETNDLAKAGSLFYEIKDKRSMYSTSAAYYWGYINYKEGKYETALKEFSKLENDSKFSALIPYYTIQIYYLQGNFEKVKSYGKDLLKVATEENLNELYKLMGDACFETNDFVSAPLYLEQYKGVGNKKTRDDYYKLGYSYYKSKQFEKAIPPFQKAAVGADLMGQNSNYHLADCYVKTNDKNKARMAFDQASKFDFDPIIQEEALFNYAKITYELSYSPFNETIKAFDEYISKYPNSERNDAAFDYLVKVYMTTKNYRDAISSIEKIKVKSPSIKEAYQRVTYYRGLELFNDGSYSQSITYFSKSLENAAYNRTFSALSQYWMAEAYFRIENYKSAITAFEKFQATPGAFSLPEYGTAYYNTGYAYFKLKNYDQAQSWFRKYIAQSKIKPDLKCDALNRIGDCYYVSRDYDQAIVYYGQSISESQYETDYAYYQRAVCYGLNRGYAQKITDLQAILDKYPKSSMVDDALYEIGKTNERLNNIDGAEENYNNLILKYPQSSFVKKALLQLGMLSYNKSMYNQSLEYYKKVVDLYPNTEEAHSAMQGIKNNYVELNNVDGFVQFTQKLGNQVSISTSEKDSLFYMAAEKQYMAGDAGAVTQFEDYLSNFPNGAFKSNAHFYIGESQYSKGEFTNAYTHYEKVIAENDNSFLEQSLAKAGEIMYSTKKFDKSIEYFTRLEKIANSKWNILKARAGLMRNYFEIGDYQRTIEAANKLISSDKVTELMVREANFKIGKSYYKLKNDELALKSLQAIAIDVKSVEGAEAKYLVARILFDQKNISESEKVISDFIEKSSPHQFWLAKSFILLSDIYASRGDNFMAINTLQSILDNYTEKTDGIIDETNTKLMALKATENKTILPEESTITPVLQPQVDPIQIEPTPEKVDSLNNN